MSATDDKNEPREAVVIVERKRSGVFCITLQWEALAPKKFLKTTKEETSFQYLAKFKIESQMCHLEITFRFVGINKTIRCQIYFYRETDFDEEEIEDCRYDFQPIVVSIVMNEEKKRRPLNYWGGDIWNYNDCNGSITCPTELRFNDITWETTNPNEWKPWTCHLWLEFEALATRKKNALKQITALYVQQIHCDVQFNFEDDQHIGGHSHILVARSPVFAAMFQHEMKETKTGQVSIPDIQLNIFKQMLHYIYSVQLSVPLTETTAQRLFEAADKYDIGDLKEECIDFLLDCIRVNNVINLMAWAHIHSVDLLTEAALTFTSLNGKEISQLKDWDSLMKNYPEVFLEATRRIIDRMVLSSESNATANSNRK